MYTNIYVSEMCTISSTSLFDMSNDTLDSPYLLIDSSSTGVSIAVESAMGSHSVMVYVLFISVFIKLKGTWQYFKSRDITCKKNKSNLYTGTGQVSGILCFLLNYCI